MVFATCILKNQWNGVSLTRKFQDTIVLKTIFTRNLIFLVFDGKRMAMITNI